VNDLILTNGIVFDGEQTIAPGEVVLQDDTVVAVRPAESKPSGYVIDAAGRLITPGLINAHTHAYSALARGMALKDPPPGDFTEILERIWWRLDRALTLGDIELSAQLHGLESLRAGVTALFDHHASQHAIQGSLEAVARGFSHLGLRACLCFEVSDRAGLPAAKAGIEENVAFLFTLSDETLRSSALACDADTVGFHIHVAEDRLDQDLTRERHGASVIERLARAGVLGRSTLCIHGVHLAESEIRILADTGAWLVHCPQSNMNNAVGAVTLAPLRSAGVNVALGSDGFTADMVREALVAHLLQNHLASSPGAGFAGVPELLLASNVHLANATFGAELGRLAPGAAADVVVWEYLPPTPLGAENIWGHLLFGLVNCRARDVIVAGKAVLRNGRSTTCDEEALAARCRTAATALWERF
jgi:cytosine/adenosine deaminase-related metal-dependent hydrolase